MPVTLEKQLELTVEDLVDAVLQLSPRELGEFELRLEEMRLARTRFNDPEMVRIAGAYRLPELDRDRLRDLLTRNHQGTLAADEESELDHYISEIDRRFETVADEILSLAERRKQDGNSTTPE